MICMRIRVMMVTIVIMSMVIVMMMIVMMGHIQPARPGAETVA